MTATALLFMWSLTESQGIRFTIIVSMYMGLLFQEKLRWRGFPFTYGISGDIYKNKKS